MQIKADLDVAKRKIAELEAELAEARTDKALLDSAQGAVSRLENEVKTLKEANSELKEKVEGFDAEKVAMLKANDEETLIKMKMAWETYFTSSFAFFEKRYNWACHQYWFEQGIGEQPSPITPIHQDDEEEEEEELAPDVTMDGDGVQEPAEDAGQ